MCAASLAPCVADVNHPGAPQPCGREGPGPGAPADYVTWYLPRRFSTTEDGNVASAYASSSYSMPGMWVTERTVQVPLDWAAPDGERIDLFIRELVDPDRRSEDLPLLTYLQGGPGGASPRPVNGSGGWLGEALKHYRVILVDQRGTGSSTPIEAVDVQARGDADAGADYLSMFRADSIVRDLEHRSEERRVGEGGRPRRGGQDVGQDVG